MAEGGAAHGAGAGSNKTEDWGRKEGAEVFEERG
jgi:hypothetical protein